MNGAVGLKCPETRVARFRGSPLLFAFLAPVFLVSLAATVYFCLSMAGGMEMRGGWTMSMIWMRMPGQSWMESAGMFLVMWIAMMIAMMLPSVMPRFLGFYDTLPTEKAPFRIAATMMAISGYFTVWTLVGMCVYPAGIFFAQAAMQWPLLSRAVPTLSGLGLVLSGIFQFSRWKMKGLGSCGCHADIRTEGKGGPLRSGWTYGVREGRYCALCCSALMLTLLILGAMSLLAMVLVAGIIAGEKFVGNYRLFSRLAGTVILLGGVVMCIRSISFW